MTLQFSSNEKTSNFRNQMNEISSSNSKLKSSEFSLFSDHITLKTWSMIGFSLGSDAHKGGCDGIGPSKMDTILKSHDDKVSNLSICLLKH